MLISALLSGDKITIFASLLASLFLVFVVVPVHEFAHVWCATKLGDNTGKMLGRYTLNPTAHIDPLGAVLICLIGFGWGKPAPINPNNFKNRKWGIALTSFAGPFANFLLAWLLLFLGSLFANVGPAAGTYLASYVYTFCYIAAEISLYLMVFNLIPVPPLDGYGVIEGLLPPSWSEWLNTHQQIISIIFIALLFTGVLSRPLSALASLILNVLGTLCALPFH